MDFQDLGIQRSWSLNGSLIATLVRITTPFDLWSGYFYKAHISPFDNFLNNLMRRQPIFTFLHPTYKNISETNTMEMPFTFLLKKYVQSPNQIDTTAIPLSAMHMRSQS